MIVVTLATDDSDLAERGVGIEEVTISRAGSPLEQHVITRRRPEKMVIPRAGGTFFVDSTVPSASAISRELSKVSQSPLELT